MESRLLFVKYLLNFEAGHAMAEFVEVLLCKPKECGFEYGLGFLVDLTLLALRWPWGGLSY